LELRTLVVGCDSAERPAIIQAVIRTRGHRRCLTLFANISGSAIVVLPRIPDTPGKLEITSAHGQCNVLGAITVMARSRAPDTYIVASGRFG
jgi:hypothetical protein